MAACAAGPAAPALPVAPCIYICTAAAGAALPLVLSDSVCAASAATRCACSCANAPPPPITCEGGIVEDDAADKGAAVADIDMVGDGADMWCVLQLFRAPRGRIQPLSQMGQDLQVHDRKWLEGLPRKQGTLSLETITETNSFRNGNRTHGLWKSTRVLLHLLAV